MPAEKDMAPQSSIVFFYSRLQPYLACLFRALLTTQRVSSIDVVHRDHGDSRGNLYKAERVDGVRYHRRSELSEDDLVDLLHEVRPPVVYISGWMDSGYLRALRRYRRDAATVVVAGIDDQWNGSVRQRLGAALYPLMYRSLIDVMWIAGGPQRVYAERFGYRRKDIIPHLLSADVQNLVRQPVGDHRRFLFVGRFDPVKGLHTLIEAYRRLPLSIRNIWSLELVGDGPIRHSLPTCDDLQGLKITPFLQPNELKRLLAGGGVACVPSDHEQWGVVVHEFAAAGYPLILSEACGAASEFLIDGYNGYLFNAADVKSLHAAMYRMTQCSLDARLLMSERSRALAMRITPELSAASLLSLLEPVKSSRNNLTCCE